MRSVTSALRRNAARILTSSQKAEEPEMISPIAHVQERARPVIDEPDVMPLDAQTFKDLEVFESLIEGGSLFDLCNFTRSRSGAAALKQRMKRPLTSPDKIRSVQRSITFILDNRPLFNTFPSYLLTQIADKYLHTSLPPLMGRNPVDFALGIIDLLGTDSRRYDVIIHGVGVTVTLLNTLYELSQQPELHQANDCELADMLLEIRNLLSHEQLAKLARKKEWGNGPWKTLRVDQVLRYDEKHAMLRLLELIHELDALLSMADATHKLGFTLPQLDDGPLSVQAEGLVHPVVPDAVANPVQLDQQKRLLFLTGPNMAGKTTYLRAFAVALYFAHLGMGVPARSFRFVPAQNLFTSLSLADNLHAGISYFRAEGLRVKTIAQALNKGQNVIALMDEPFKGTNVKDAFDASRAILERLANRENSLFMFSSHLIELSEHFVECPQIDCRFFEALEDEGRLRFDYTLHPGISSQRLGMRVLQEEGIFDLLDELC